MAYSFGRETTPHLTEYDYGTAIIFGITRLSDVLKHICSRIPSMATKEEEATLTLFEREVLLLLKENNRILNHQLLVSMEENIRRTRSNTN